MAFIDGTVVNLALPRLQADFQASATNAHWVVESYTLLLASMLLLGGYLGDVYGHTKTHQVKGRLARVDANLMYLHSDHPPCQKLPLRSSCSHRDIKRRTIFCAGLYSVIRLTAGLKPISNGENRPSHSLSPEQEGLGCYG